MWNKDEKTMTTREYLDKLKKENIDEVFDKAVKQAHELDLRRMQSEAYNKQIINLITKLADKEAELGILEDLYVQELKTKPFGDSNSELYKEDIRKTKVQYTRIKNELDKLIKLEIKNNV